MVIEFVKCPIGLGYSYRKGSVAASLPDKDCKILIDAGFARDITPKKVEKPKKAEVTKAVVRDSKKTVVK